MPPIFVRIRDLHVQPDACAPRHLCEALDLHLLVEPALDHQVVDQGGAVPLGAGGLNVAEGENLPVPQAKNA
eukprot:7386651-Pyramimonas_sp.AAC.1